MDQFPAAVPEIPVSDLESAIGYYQSSLGFRRDWGGQDGGIAGISRGHCRLFLTDVSFREAQGNCHPVVIWINLVSRKEVSTLHEDWRAQGARILSEPEDKPWKLFEFTAADPDGNRLRVFYDIRWEAEELGGGESD